MSQDETHTAFPWEDPETNNEPSSEVPVEPEQAAHESPTLLALEPNRRPPPEVVCAGCPNSMWFASNEETRCYCRVMFLVSWSTKEPNAITLCDGVTIGREAD